MERLTKPEKSWIFYDWANSVYVAVMISAVFPVYLTSEIGRDGDLWWSLGTFAATFTIALLGPFMGALADYRGMKKKLFSVFLSIGLLFTLLTAFAGQWQLMLLGYVLSHIGFLGANLYYDSFLTDVTGKERMDKVSSWGYGMGYIGGSTIPLLLGLGVIAAVAGGGFEFKSVVKPAILIAVGWWAVFSIPLLKNVRQKHCIEKPEGNLVHTTLRGLGDTIGEISGNKKILFFLLAYFFYIDGVNTIITMATSYGTALGLDAIGMLLALLVTQVVAFPFSILFGKLAGRFGAINLIMAAVGVYTGICPLASFMGFGLEEGFLRRGDALVLFWVLAISVGTCQGGIQALSRSFYGKLIPADQSSRYFGFYDIFGKFAAVMGPGLYGLVKNLTGRSSLSILSIVVLFIIGGVFLTVERRLFRQK